MDISIKDRLQKQLDLELEHPELEEHGDFSSNVALQEYSKSKTLNSNDQINSKFKNPKEYAEELAGKIKIDDLVQKVEVAGPGFLNIWLQTDALIKELQRVLNEAGDYGKSQIGEGKTVVIDYSAPNIAKRFGIGHLRSTIIGQALYNIYAFLGYKTIGDNHLGDWGTQFGKILFMISDLGLSMNDLSIDDLEKLYVDFHKKAIEDPNLEDKGREWFKKLEDGDPIARKLWQACVDISIKEFDRIYSLLGVQIDYSYGEAFYSDKMEAVIVDAKAKKVAVGSEGALVIEIPGTKIPLMLVKSDGTSTYANRDLAALKFRKVTWNPDLVIYEVGNEQTLHFEQVFAAARILGYVSKDTKLVHTRHGLYLNPDGKKFSTRKGDTVNLEEVLEEAIDRAKKMGSEETAKAVGVGAIKYFDLSHNIQSDIVFDWESIMALDGNSGPYIQYAYARIQSILQKANFEIRISKFEFNLISELSKEEIKILRWVYKFPEVVEAAAERFAPNLVCQYLYELAGRFNTFYNQHSILSADNIEVRKFRWLLTAATGQVLENGLKLLGIEALGRM